jgi:hypothetical protein
MKKIFLILSFFFIIHFGYSQTAKPNPYVKLLVKYDEWLEKQYQLGNYVRPSECNMDNESASDGEGIDESIQVYYSDMNDDNKLDAVVTMSPYLCSGGNALMHSQVTIIILSNGSSFYVDDKLIPNLEKKLSSGWFNINGASYGMIFGNFMDFSEDDARCCPSIKKPFQINYSTKKLEYTNY